MSTTDIEYYSPLEEKLNILSHAFGIILSIFAFFLLLLQTITHGNIWHIISSTVFSTSLIILYSASTCYHSSTTAKTRYRLRIFDHASIYLLIAGTYTPFTLVTLHGTTGWILFGLSWGIAIVGITLKLFFTGRYDLLSTLMYLSMGWMIIFFIKPLIRSLPEQGIKWLIAGGLIYTLGAIFYAIERLKFNHALFHLMVLLGSTFHFIAIYCYVLV